jgi:putative acetyltransferase
MPYYIDIVHKSEYANIVALWEASVRVSHAFLTEEDIQYFKPLILNSYLDQVKLFCARNEDNKIVGFLGVAKGKIEMMFVHPHYMNRGIGRRLIRYSIDKLDATRVDVNEQNPKAQSFYEYFGFKAVGRSRLDGTGKPYPIIHMELSQQT